MLRNIKMILQYDGAGYSGWQKQGNSDNTVQAVLERMLSRLLCADIELIGSGRTDAGVHAYCQTANFFTSSQMPAADIMRFGNQYLPLDIAIKEIYEADARFHSRYNAVAKTYLYKLWTGKTKNVFERKYYYDLSNADGSIDVNKMITAASSITGKHDFAGFSSLKKTKKSTVRTVYSIDIVPGDSEINIYIRADGFLYNMARIIVGTLIEAGYGKIEHKAINAIFETKSREQAGITAPPNALFLYSVEYGSI